MKADSQLLWGKLGMGEFRGKFIVASSGLTEEDSGSWF